MTTATRRDRVVIIEDDPTMRRVLRDNLEFSGYEVRTAHDGSEGMQVVHESAPDLVLLDIMLPRLNGFDVCRAIRQEGLTVPIIMLTAKNQESDIVRGLNLGADDYVPKPFSIDVLLARASACIRRRRHGHSERVSFGRCKLDWAAHQLFRDDREVWLTPKEFRLLEFFVRNAGRALTRDRILDAVWGDELIVTQRSVDRCVNTLRTKIEERPEDPDFIKTIRDVGYRFELP